MKLVRVIRFGAVVFLLGSLPESMAGQQTEVASSQLSSPHAQFSSGALLEVAHRYWDKNYLINFGAAGSDDASPSHPVVTLYDRDGRLQREAVVWFKNATRVSISDVAVGKKGELVVAGGAMDQSGVIANFITLIGDDGRVSKTVRTTPFLPHRVCVAENGNVWAYGSDRSEQGERVETSLMLREYDFEKGQVKALLAKSELNPWGWTLSEGRYPEEFYLRCAGSKVGLYNGASSEWIEYDKSAQKLKIAKVAPLPPPSDVRIRGFALTESGQVFASMHYRTRNPVMSGLFKLEFGNDGVGHWMVVKGTFQPFRDGIGVGQLLGTDGTELIYTRGPEATTAYWSKIAK